MTELATKPSGPFLQCLPLACKMSFACGTTTTTTLTMITMILLSNVFFYSRLISCNNILLQVFYLVCVYTMYYTSSIFKKFDASKEMKERGNNTLMHCYYYHYRLVCIIPLVRPFYVFIIIILTQSTYLFIYFF